jgi:hypothetical protein
VETSSVLLTAIGLVFVLEGMLYALFPNGMKQTVAKLLEMSDGKVREVGLIAAVIGVFIVWLAQ